MPLESLLLHVKVRSESHCFRLKACAKIRRLKNVKNRQKSQKLWFEPWSQTNQNTNTQNFDVNGKNYKILLSKKISLKKNLEKTLKISNLPLVKNAEESWSVKFRMSHTIRSWSRDVTKFTGWCHVVHIYTMTKFQIFLTSGTEIGNL